jgi:hypothetical protein
MHGRARGRRAAAHPRPADAHPPAGGAEHDLRARPRPSRCALPAATLAARLRGRATGRRVPCPRARRGGRRRAAVGARGGWPAAVRVAREDGQPWWTGT